ncbi:MAG: serine/threonine protein kinase [Alloscardovia omnicolens]|uniref:serine/threonine-protein kinase n=2 Tax=Alloscardovia omnicolens TaxID=419015 RepID=UPI00242E4146|nr:serine/threonine-protein kinase [Alloscardovia omnicolens]MBS6345819.1 serine/threonine protein kinase [Alloscardovia omnicolens]
MAEHYSALDLAPGDLVGGYTLLNRLDQGGMGTIWRVRDDGGNIFAMKVLLDSLKEEDENGNLSDNTDKMTARERFRREALALRRIDHPGVNHIVDMELDDALAFIVTELIEGKNLRDDVYENGRYTAEDLDNLARMLIDAVDAVHAAGIIHRDLKPTNVMISPSGPVLVDFGIAMGENESHVTRTGLVMGTPGFIAPEIIEGAESDEATDWWSVAAVLGFAATGKPVFGSKPLMTVLERAASGNADLFGLPPLTLHAMRMALNPDRMQRCSAQELLSAIHEEAQTPDIWDNGPHDIAVSEQISADEGAGRTSVVPPFSRNFSRDDNTRNTGTDKTVAIGSTRLMPTDAQNATPEVPATRVMASAPISSIPDDNSTRLLWSAPPEPLPVYSEPSSSQMQPNAAPVSIATTVVYQWAWASIIVSLAAFFPALSLLAVMFTVMWSSIRGSRTQARLNNPNVSAISLSLALPWHILKAAVSALWYGLRATILLALFNGIFLGILSLSGFTVGFGQWTSLFVIINICAMSLSWLFLLAKPAQETIRLGLKARGRSNVSVQTRFIEVSLWALAIISILALSATIKTVTWDPLPNIQYWILSTIPSLV